MLMLVQMLMLMLCNDADAVMLMLCNDADADAAVVDADAVLTVMQ